MSWYGEPFHGRTTASGEVYDMNEISVAHKELPFGTMVEFSYQGRTMVAEVTDRGPFIPGREWDASRALFDKLTCGELGRGVIYVGYLIVSTSPKSASGIRVEYRSHRASECPRKEILWGLRMCFEGLLWQPGLQLR